MQNAKNRQKFAIWAPSHNFVGLYLHNEGMYRQSEKTCYTSSICTHNTANFGPLTAEIGSGVWGTPANFNGFRVLASLVQRRRSPEANQTLHGVWPSPGLLHYVYIFGGSCPLTEFRHVQNSLCIQVLRSLLHWQHYCTALQPCSNAGKTRNQLKFAGVSQTCLLYTSPSPRDRQKSRMPSSA